MNGEVKRPQSGGHLAGAQGPHRVPPAKAVRKSRQFLRAGLLTFTAENDVNARLREVDSKLFGFPSPSPERGAVHYSLARIPSLVAVVAAALAVILLSVCAVLITRT